jgi:iron complex transport system substrate-binding protein
VQERLQPTHIVTQIQCEVCAVSLRDVEAAIARGMKSKPQIVSLRRIRSRIFGMTFGERLGR